MACVHAKVSDVIFSTLKITNLGRPRSKKNTHTKGGGFNIKMCEGAEFVVRARQNL